MNKFFADSFYCVFNKLKVESVIISAIHVATTKAQIKSGTP